MRRRRERLLRTLQINRSAAERPLPRVTISTGGWLPCWSLRALIGLVGLGCLAIFAVNPVIWMIGLAGLVVVLAQPASIAPASYALGLAIVMLATTPDPFAVRGFLLLLGIHLLIILCSLTADLPLMARVELAALARPARRFVIIQLSCQGLALAAAWLTGC